MLFECFHWWATARCASASCARRSAPGPSPRAARAERRRPARAAGGQRARHRRDRARRAAARAGGRARLHARGAGQRRRLRAARDRAPEPRQLPLRDGQRPADRRARRHRRAARRAASTSPGTSAQGAHNFNAPRAVCIAAVLYVFRTLIADAIPLNEGCLEPLEIMHPARLDARPATARRGRRRQRRDLAVHRRRAVRRARGAGRLPGHHEQPHLRRRTAAVLRDHLRRAPAPDRTSTAATRCRLT